MRHPRGHTQKNRQIKEAVSIRERPAIMESCSRLGDWELDTIIGNGYKQALISLTEGTSSPALIAEV